MKGITRHCRVVVAVLVAALALVPTTGASAIQSEGGGTRAPLAAVGVVDVGGRRVLAEVYVRVPSGSDGAQVARDALRAAGARPMTQADVAVFGFTTFIDGVVWGQFQDRRRQNDVVVQQYNPAGDPTDGQGLQALLNTHRTWNDVRTSRFRFEFGGQTDRPLALLDGFNDVAWGDAGYPHTLGITYSAYTQTAILESDVIMNTAIGPSQWRTDGSDFDVESVMLHENGHVLGLGHSDDSRAIMYPTYRQTQRYLGADDIAGVTFLYPTGGPSQDTNTRAASVPFRLVAESPGEFEVGDLNDRGDASYSRYLFEGEELTLAMGAERRVVARTGDPAPGGGTLGLGILGRLDLDGSGDAAFAFALDPLQFPLGVNAGVYRHRNTTGRLEAVVSPGVTPVPGGGGSFAGARDAALSDSGDVAFTGIAGSVLGTPEWPSLGVGVYVAAAAGGIRAVAIPGTPAPGGGAFDFAAQPSINAAGDVAFEGKRSGQPCGAPSNPHIFFACRGEVHVASRRTGTIRRVAGPGDRLPAGGTLSAATGPVISDAGSVAFLADLAPGPRFVDGAAIVVAQTDGRLSTVVRTGDEMPGGGRVLDLPDGPPGYTVGAGGQVAFTAVLDTVNPATGFQDMGLYLWSRAGLQLLARSGTIVPQVGTIGQLSAAYRGTSLGFSGAVLNERGQVLFQATLTDGRGVLLVATGDSVDPCVDSLSPSGESLFDTAGLENEGDRWYLVSSQSGAVCRRTPLDLFHATLSPHPEVEGGQAIEATLRFDPALGRAGLRVLACDGLRCGEALAVGSSSGEPGVVRVRHHNSGSAPQRIAIEVAHESGRLAIRYDLDARVNIPPPFIPPPPPEPTHCDDPGFRDLASPGEHHVVGVLCSEVPYNLFRVELDDGASLGSALAFTGTPVDLVVYVCGEEFCEPAVRGAPDESGVLRAPWDNCTGGVRVVLIGVELTLEENQASYELDVVAKNGTASCGP